MADLKLKPKIIVDDENNATKRTTGLLQKSKKSIKKDPLLVQTVSLHEDIYALSWNACRSKSWEHLEVHGVKISLTNYDHFVLVAHFLFFICIVILTVGILLIESFISDSYKDSTWPIYVLRITLVAFAQKKLEPELFQGLTMYRYTCNHREEFFHPCFAKFIGFCQFAMAALTFIAIFLFVCMSNEALTLIMNFAGLAVISELDDWVGEQIMSESIPEEFDEDSPFTGAILKKEGLNERMNFYTKLCLIGEDMEIEDDQNNKVGFLTTIANSLPWVLLPLLTIPCEYLLLWIQGRSHPLIHN